MRVRILGSAAGGGLPQWNCRCANCQAARNGSPDVRPRTQSSVAVSADGCHWFLLNASADVRTQVAALPELWPPEGDRRGTTIAGCILTDAEIDHTSGLLQLREGCSFAVYSTATVRRWLNSHFPIAPMLSPFADRPWLDLPLDVALELPLPKGTPSGLRLRAFEIDRDVPRFVPEHSNDAVGARIGLEIEDAKTHGKLVYAPGFATVVGALQKAAESANCLLIDGTFWSDDEPKKAGIANTTARQMGHLPIDGFNGSLGWLSKVEARNRVYVHINNTNPILNTRSREHRAIHAAGIRVAEDGDLFDL